MGGAGLLGPCPAPELDSLEEDPFEACLGADFVELGVVELGVVEAGVVEVGVDVCPAPVPELAPVLDTLITSAGAAGALEAGELARPINTPTPIESSRTPTPAITAVVLPARGGSAAGARAG